MVKLALPCFFFSLVPLSLGQNLTLQGGGASFPESVYQDAIRAYSFSETGNAQISYTSMGSGKGKCRIASWEVSERLKGACSSSCLHVCIC